jgi:hypothetical protein
MKVFWYHLHKVIASTSFNWRPELHVLCEVQLELVMTEETVAFLMTVLA